MWLDDETKCYTLIALITSTVTGDLNDIIDYDYVHHLEQDEGVLIRHTRHEGETLTDADMTAAGAMVMQMWLTGETQHDVIAREREIRSKIYRIAPEGLEYPEYWVAE